MRRREFITLLGGAVAAWPLAVRAQQPSMPVIGFLGATSPQPSVKSLNVDLTAKRLGLLRELAPQATRFVALVSPNAVNTDAIVKEVHASVPILGSPVEILYAGTSDRDIDAAFANLSQKPGAALLVTVDPFFFERRALIVALAARHALPTVYFRREYADIGGLVSFWKERDHLFQLTRSYTRRVLQSEENAAPPRLSPTTIALVI